MPSQQQIENFTLAFHQAAMKKLRLQPELRLEALEVIRRWELAGATSAGQRWRDVWKELLVGDLDTLERAVCIASEQAATLRSMSPLGFLFAEDERLRIRREAMAA